MIKKLLMLILIVFAYLWLHGSPGCMDTSYHLEAPCDPKIEYLVVRQYGDLITHCPCPCNQIFLARGRCIECGHVRYLKSSTIVEPDCDYQPKPIEKSKIVQEMPLKERAMMRVLNEYLNGY